MHTDDYIAVNAVLHGDKDSYEKLIDKYKNMVYGIAWSNLGDVDLSEDAAQETFVKAYTYLGTLREPDKFAGWLAGIARNVCGSLGREIRRRNAFHKRWAVLESTEAGPQEEDHESISHQLWDSFAKLPTIHREALTLFYVEGKSIAEASSALGISEQTMRTRLHRARTSLRTQLEQMLEESLSDLQPSKGFTRSVLVLLPLAPKGATGVGLLAVIGKLSASISFTLWTLAVSALPLWAYFSLLGRVEESSLADVPQNQRARAIIRRTYRKFAYIIFVINAAFFMLGRYVGMTTAFQIMAIVDVCIFLIAASPLLLGRLRIMDIISSGILLFVLMFAAIAAVAFFNAPAITLSATWIVMSGVMYFAAPHIPLGPEKVGYNLFLRQAKRPPELPEIDLPLSHELSRLELRAFARLLVELRLARDYRLEGDRIRISLYGMGFGLAPSGSEMTIRMNGECSTIINNADLQVIRRMVDPSISESDLKERSCRTIRYALSRFAEGRLQEVHDILSVSPDRSSMIRVRNLRIMCLINIWMFSTMAVAPYWVRSTIQNVISLIISLGVPLIALAITLHINKRQMSSTQN